MSDPSAISHGSQDVPGAHGPPIPRWIEFSAVSSVLLLAAYFLVRLILVIDGWSAAAFAIGGALIAYVAADFVSGVIHWAFDRLGSRETPIIGESFIQPFRYHHIDPKDMMNGDFINTNGKNSLAILPILFLGFLIPISSDASWSIFALGFLNFFALGIWMTNQFHKWAHLDHPGPVIHWLQRMHLVLGPEHHAKHHVWPHACNYCITSGWCNPICEALGIFRVAERILVRIGITPASG